MDAPAAPPLDETQLRAALEAAMDPVEILVPVLGADGQICDYRIRYVNSALAAAAGVPADELTGALLREAFPEVSAEFMSMLDTIVHTGRHLVHAGIAMPSAVRRSVRRFNVSGVPFGDGVIFTFRDVTDEFDTLQRLSRSERLYRLLAENITDVVFVLRDEIITWASPSSEAVLGWRADDLIGRCWREFIASEDHDSITSWLTDETADARARFRVRYLTRADEVHWSSLLLSPLVDEAGNPDGILVSGRRIDEEMAAEAEVLKAHRQRDRLIEQLPVGVYRARLSVTKGLTLDFVSPLAWELLGASPDAGTITLEDILHQVHPADQAGLLAAGQATVAGGRPLLWEGRLADPKSETWLRIQAQIEDEGGELVLEGILADITKFKQLEVELARKATASTRRADRLAEIDRAKSALLGSLGHDLRTPLTVISSAAASLRYHETLSPDQRIELLANIERSSELLSHLLTNLLDLGRIEVGVLPVRLGALDIVEVLEVPLGVAGVEVELDLPDDLPCVRADAVLLERVLDNLLRNAHRHQPRGVPVKVAAKLDNGRVHLQVIDRGTGVPFERYQEIFTPFKRSSDYKGDGIGIGLAIARAFTLAMGGTLTPSATPGGGLTMTTDLEECDASVADR